MIKGCVNCGGGHELPKILTNIFDRICPNCIQLLKKIPTPEARKIAVKYLYLKLMSDDAGVPVLDVESTVFGKIFSVSSEADADAVIRAIQKSFNVGTPPEIKEFKLEKFLLDRAWYVELTFTRA